MCVDDSNPTCRDPIVKNHTNTYFQSFLQNASVNGWNVLLSAEIFDDPRIDVRRLKDTLLSKHRFQVHIVMSYRRFYDWLHSFHNQYVKRGKLTSTFVQWVTRENAMKSMSEFYTSRVYSRYRAIPEFTVSVMNMHDIDDDETQLTHFFCHHVANAKTACRRASQTVADGKANQSRGIDRTLLVAAIKKRHPDLDLDKVPGGTARIEAMYEDMAGRGAVPTLCLPGPVQERLLNMSIEMEISLTTKEFYTSERGTKSLKADFQEQVKSKLCSIDVDTILESSDWKNLLSTFTK
jgi:hypothetical protein